MVQPASLGGCGDQAIAFTGNTTSSKNRRATTQAIASSRTTLNSVKVPFMALIESVVFVCVKSAPAQL